MGLQLPLPAGWARDFVSLRDPVAELESIARDKLDAKVKLRAALEQVALSHGISHSVINAAIKGYADDMLSDLFYEVEAEITREIESSED